MSIFNISTFSSKCRYGHYYFLNIDFLQKKIDIFTHPYEIITGQNSRPTEINTGHLVEPHIERPIEIPEPL